MAINFDKFAAEGNEFINELSRNLGHKNDKGQVGILLRAVLHELRDCISFAQSLNLIGQLPMFLKAIYVEQWRYTDQHPRVKTMNDFAKRVEEEQRKFGERQFDWNENTVDIVKTILNTIYNRYLTAGQIEGIRAELGGELKALFPESVKTNV